MKKFLMLLLMCAMLACGVLAGCGKTEEPDTPVASEIPTDDDFASETDAEEEVPPVEEEVAPPNSYRSELTNEWIDVSIQNQRPVAIMVDNEKTALDHYGLTQADIVYEMMNSTANDEITRFMAIVKDWGSITRFGSIRSVRPTNFMISPEYDAVVIHDGGPFYIDAFLQNPWVEHLSGGFARIDNGKAREFTEYVTTGEIESRLEANGISKEYTGYYPGPHWQFAPASAPVDLSAAADSQACSLVDLPFDHNGSELNYDEASGTYLYSEYGKAHVDPENDNKQLAFKNVIIQCAERHQYDENGYMQFNLINESGKGYYITDGHAVPITWEKGHDASVTKYYDASGNEIVLNTGKTYVGLVANHRWSDLVLK